VQAMLPEGFPSHQFKVVRHIEMPKSSPKQPVCDVQKLAIILK